MVVHTAVDSLDRGVLRLLALAEHLDALLLVFSHQLLGLLALTVELLDPGHGDCVLGPAGALLSAGVGQSDADLALVCGLLHQVPAGCHVLGVCGLVISFQLEHVASSLDCLKVRC